MSVTTTIYLIEILESVNTALILLISVGIIIFIISAIAFANLCDDCEETKLYNISLRILKKYWVLLIILGISIFIPSKNSMYLILGSKYLSQSNLPTKVEKAITLKIDEYILDMENNLNRKKE